MLKSIKNWLILFLFIGNFYTNAQDQFLQLDGKVKKGKFIEIKNDILFYEIEKNDKKKIKYISILDIYSHTDESGAERVLYVKDTTIGLYLTVDEMRRYVEGARLAHERYKSPVTSIIGVFAGLTGGYVGVYGLTIPAAYVVASGIMYPDPEMRSYYPREKLEDYLFRAGFNDYARRKKTMNAIKGSLIGLGIFGIYTIIISI